MQSLLDGVTGSPVTASARFFQTLLFTGGIVAGVAIGLNTWELMGLGLPPLETMLGTPTFSGAAARIAGSTLASASFAVTCFAERPAVVVAAFTAAAGSSMYYLFLIPIGSGALMATAALAFVVGHFPGLERTLRDVADLYVFERVQRPGDYPDSAFEYLAPDLDAVFITASALVNKTMPRLLELASGLDTIIVGPSTPMTPTLFDAGATTLSGFIPTDPAGLVGTLKGIGGGRKWDFGKRVNVSVDSSALLEWRNR